MINVSVNVGEGTAPLILPSNQIEVSDQIRISAPLLLRTDAPLPVQKRARWTPESLWTFRRTKNQLHRLRIEPSVQWVIKCELKFSEWITKHRN